MNKKLTLLWATKTKDDEWWSSFVTSPMAIIVNYFVVDFKWLTPNIITLISFITAIIASLFIIVGGTPNFIIAAFLIHLSHIFDCMDGQMARYRKITSLSGAFYDKLTDQIQVTIWFGAIGYAAYNQSNNVLPIFLTFIGVSFYSLRGYIKYITIHSEMSRNNMYLENISKQETRNGKQDIAGINFSLIENSRWLIAEQKKIFLFDEGVFIFMLSFALIFNVITPMLWIFAASQLFYGLMRGWQRGQEIEHTKNIIVKK